VTKKSEAGNVSRTAGLAGRLIRAGLAVAVLGSFLPAAAMGMPARKDFVDPGDGWLDIGGFLDQAYGFVPIIAPITEPAVGYGAAGALVFVNRQGEPGSERYQRPNLAAVGGLATENGTRAAFAGHTGRWLDGRLQTLVGIGDASVNLEFYPSPDTGFGYTAEARGLLVEGKYRLGGPAWWAGLRYSHADVTVRLDTPEYTPPDFVDGRETRLAGVSAILTCDKRDNFFTPTSGYLLDLTGTAFAEAIGSDRDFQRADLVGQAFHPLSKRLFLGVKGVGRWSGDGTPFYLRPFVQLRGVQALRYQGTEAGEIEAEVRWQLHPRFSLLAFGGAGAARGREALDGENETVAAGGAGFRYLIARSYGMHLGVDVARGPEQTIFYVVFGNAWFRP
jgi:hypothetical protein